MAEKTSKEPIIKEIPDIIVNPKTSRKYIKGKFLGKGGFARCFELIDASTKATYAGKIVSKSLLTKKHQKDKMAQEIFIHRSLNHQHIVKFVSYFEDADNVYILLELCARRSLMELHKRRRAITEPETRYFMHQIVKACEYLHDNKVIHRDLKQGNLFLNDDMEIKIGDFGLATKLDYDGERKRTLCGTPNYIAPEMLNKNGHSFEVDVWALGCIMYTLLLGKPPFETESLKETYNRIKCNNYVIPSRVSPAAQHMIRKLLQNDPQMRPTVHEILSFDFFTRGYMPSALPTTCLTVAPNFSRNSPVVSASTRRPLADNTNKERVASPLVQARKDQMGLPVRALKSVPENQVLDTGKKLSSELLVDEKSGSPENLLTMLQREIVRLCLSRPTQRPVINQDEAQDPAATPVFWIGKWVDYSDKYGLGYQLCDNSVGVWFNDFSKLLMNANGESLQYIDRDGTETFYTLKSYPSSLLQKKVTLLSYFRNYMNEHLLKDHTKLIMCPLMAAVTYINENRDFRTYKFADLEKHGCTQDL